jgi:hypothetical protein
MKYHLRCGVWITNKRLTQIRLELADKYDGLIKDDLIIVNHAMAAAIRNKSNTEFADLFGLINMIKK